MTLTERDRQALAGVLTDAHFPELPNFQRGKVRESYDLPDGRRRGPAIYAAVSPWSRTS